MVLLLEVWKMCVVKKLLVNQIPVAENTENKKCQFIISHSMCRWQLALPGCSALEVSLCVGLGCTKQIVKAKSIQLLLSYN